MQSKPINPNHKDMKKLTFLTLMAVVLLFVDCKDNGENQSGKTDGDNTEASTAQEQAPVQIDTLHTPDLTLFELQGPVKSVKSGDSENEILNDLELNFDEHGRLTKMNEYSISYESNPNGVVEIKSKYLKGKEIVERDKEGRLLAVAAGEGCGGSVGYYFTYKKGKLTEYRYEYSECYLTSYEVEVKGYDAQGRISKDECGMCDEDAGCVEMTTTYTITKTDEWGNWTERKAKIHSVITEYEEGYGDECTTSTKNMTVTEKRTITYY